jgi:hypothetical protein
VQPGAGGSTAFESIELPDVGRVSLATLEQLRQALRAEQAQRHELGARAAAITASILDKLADAGAALVPQRAYWPVPAELEPSLGRADELVAQMAGIDEQRQQSADTRRGFLERIGAWREDRRRRSAREAARREVHAILLQTATCAFAAQIGSPDAMPMLNEVRRLEDEAAELHSRSEAAAGRAGVLKQEVAQRDAAQRQMGFDALYAAAYLARFGPQAVSSPLQLKAGEVAVISVPCTLARMTTRSQYVRGSRGIRVPVGHTGIAFRVGAYRGHRVQQQVLRHLDKGTLVVSTQRLAFIGRLKSVVIQLRRVTNVDIYNDALAVFHEGRETADFLLVDAPKQVAFYLNWTLQRNGTGSRPASAAGDGPEAVLPTLPSSS